jgi:hypothetical protein
MGDNTPDYQLGNKAKATIGTTRIKGLNSLTIPGIERNTVDVEEFEQDFDFTVPTSAKWTEGSMAGNYVRKDTTGQRALRTKLFDNEGLANLRLYEDEDDFWAPDLANNEDSVIFVKSIPGPEITKSGLTAFSATLLVQGLLALFTAHNEGGTNLAFVAGTGSGDTITDSESGFIAAGFEVGQTVLIEGSSSNDTVAALVTNVEAGTLTLSTDTSTDGLLTAEVGVAATVIHGGAL